MQKKQCPLEVVRYPLKKRKNQSIQINRNKKEVSFYFIYVFRDTKQQTTDNYTLSGYN